MKIIKKRQIKNKHNEKIIDTIYTFIDTHNNITVNLKYQLTLYKNVLVHEFFLNVDKDKIPLSYHGNIDVRYMNMNNFSYVYNTKNVQQAIIDFSEQKIFAKKYTLIIQYILKWLADFQIDDFTKKIIKEKYGL